MPDAALALNRLHDHRCGVARNCPGDHFRFVVRDEGDAREKRRERRAIVLIGRHRQRAHRAAVERIFERDDFRPRFSKRVPIPTRKLQTGLNRFGAAVAEEGARQPGEVREPFRELTLQRMKEQVRRMQQRLGLLGDRHARARDWRGRAKRRRCPTAGPGTRGRPRPIDARPRHARA